jgi:hypothetical protein
VFTEVVGTLATDVVGTVFAVTTTKVFDFTILLNFEVADTVTVTLQLPVVLVAIFFPLREHPDPVTFQVTSPLEFVDHTFDGEMLDEGSRVDTFQEKEAAAKADTS